jgi:hypothetical protein
MIDQMGALLAANPTFYQGSGADIRNGRDISRIYFWPKDLQVPVSPYRPAPDALVALVDVDYYVDLNEFLLDNFLPVVMYTFQPSTVAESNGEYAFTFLIDGSVRYQVSGGSGYSHKIWSFAGDSIMVARKRFGFVQEASSYLIERRYVDKHHQIVCLIPIFRYVGFAAWVACQIVGVRMLEHLNPVTDRGFLRMETKTPDGLLVHTGKAGLHAACTLPKEVDDRLAIAQGSMAKGLTMGAVARIVNSQERDLALEMVHAFYTSGGAPTRAASAVVDPFVRSYQFVQDINAIDVDARTSMVSFMHPFLDKAFVPAQCRSGDERAVQKRVVAIANSTVVTPFLSNCIDQFLKILIAGWAHSLDPVDEDEIYARQPRPTQQTILRDSEWESRTGVAKSFVKNEAGQGLTDQRLISTVSGRDKREYSAYTYAAADFIKSQPWYAFGKSPLEIAERVSEICAGSGSVIMTDFSRMDGRVSEVARTLEQRFMVGLFRKHNREEILRLLKTQHGLAGRTRFGVSYETLLARLSGSPETSLFNTLLNVFCAFVNFRMTAGPRGFFTPEEAFARLGIYAGDDGLTGNADSKTYERAATQVGQFLTAETKLKGEAGVAFLSRHYGPDVWWGAPQSICDTPRLLSKFHVTVRMQSNIGATDKLWDKAYAVWLTDANTPIIGPFVTKVLALSSKTPSEFANLSGAWNVEVKECQYPNEPADWMVDHVQTLLPEFPTDRYHEWLDSVRCLNDMLSMPEWNERPEAVNKTDAIAYVDGVVIPPAEHAGTPPAPQLPGGSPNANSDGWKTVVKKGSARRDRGRGSPLTKDETPPSQKSGKAPRKTTSPQRGDAGESSVKTGQRGQPAAKKRPTKA